MLQKILCKCDYPLEVTVEPVINLDEQPSICQDIKNGTFLSYICPACGSKVLTELRTEFLWPSKKTALILIPEAKRIECLSFCAGKKRIDPETDTVITEPLFQPGCTPVIGYPELADRIAVLDAGLEPELIEALKYLILIQGKERIAGKKIQLLFERKNDDTGLTFHLHGLREQEIALMTIPPLFYERLYADKQKKSYASLFKALYLGAYLSYKNIAIEGEDHV